MLASAYLPSQHRHADGMPPDPPNAPAEPPDNGDESTADPSYDDVPGIEQTNIPDPSDPDNQ